MRKFFAACSVAMLVVGCVSHKSPQQTLVDDRHMVYTETYKAYIKAEEDYLNLLYNLEMMPEEDELWIMKRDRMLELNQLRELMLTARGELDDALQEWERYMVDLKDRARQEQMKQFNPNFTGKDGMRTSPGQLLPGEVPNKKK